MDEIRNAINIIYNRLYAQSPCRQLRWHFSSLTR